MIWTRAQTQGGRGRQVEDRGPPCKALSFSACFPLRRSLTSMFVWALCFRPLRTARGVAGGRPQCSSNVYGAQKVGSREPVTTSFARCFCNPLASHWLLSFSGPLIGRAAGRSAVALCACPFFVSPSATVSASTAREKTLPARVVHVRIACAERAMSPSKQSTSFWVCAPPSSAGHRRCIKGGLLQLRGGWSSPCRWSLVMFWIRSARHISDKLR